MTELLQIENKLSEILDELKKMNERFKYSSDPDTKQILKELKEMNARAREEEYKKNTLVTPIGRTMKHER